MPSAEITSYKPLKTIAPLLAQSSNGSPHGMRRRFTRHELALAEEVRDSSIRSMSLTDIEMEKS
jgi:hypothetical protein